MRDFFGSKMGRIWVAGVAVLLVLAIISAAASSNSENTFGGSDSSVYVEPSGDPTYDNTYDNSYTTTQACNYYYQGQCYQDRPRLANGCPVDVPYPQSASPGHCATRPNPYYNP